MTPRICMFATLALTSLQPLAAIPSLFFALSQRIASSPLRHVCSLTAVVPEYGCQDNLGGVLLSDS